MNEDKPPSLFGQKILFVDRIPELGDQEEITLIPVIEKCDQCGDDKLLRLPCLKCADAEITSENHREICGENLDAV